jgi:hypothetical protein
MSKVKMSYRAGIIIIAPAVMFFSFVYHPHIGSPLDADFLDRFASAVMADPFRWGVVHYITGIGCGLMMLAFLAIRNHFSERSGKTKHWFGTGLHFIIMGNLFYAFLPSMEMGAMVAAEINADVAAFQGTLMSWFAPTLLTSALLFSTGAVCFATGIIRAGLWNRSLCWVIAAALVLTGLSRFAPLNVIQFYVQGIAGILALWPIAWMTLKQQTVEKEAVAEAVATG